MADPSPLPPPRTPARLTDAPPTPLVVTRLWLDGELPVRRTTAGNAREWLLGTLAGKALLLGLVIKVVIAVVRRAVDPLPAWLSPVDAPGTHPHLQGHGDVIGPGAVW